MCLIGDPSRRDLIRIGDSGRVRNDGGLDGGGGGEVREMETDLSEPICYFISYLVNEAGGF